MNPEEKQLQEQIALAEANGLVALAKDLRSRLIKIQMTPKVEREVKFPKNLGVEAALASFITQDSDCLKLKDQVRKLASTSYSVLVQGESGTGKELIARALHGNRSGPMVCINCAGLPDHLIESELFGHVRGAFTGAERDKEGLFQAAQGGTLFLDEIGDLNMNVQAKLLRALQFRSVRKVGGNKEEDINCRFVAATHWDLADRVEQGMFRKDLYYRLSTFTLWIKPLYQRPDDLNMIAEKLCPSSKEIDWKNLKMDLGGNVRSLERYVLRWKVFGELPEQKTKSS